MRTRRQNCPTRAPVTVETDPARLAKQVGENPGKWGEVIRGLGAKAARLKYGSAKALLLLGETHPELLYPQFDGFVKLLDHPNKILQWQAGRLLAQLARVDAAGKFERILEKYFAPIPGPVMITAANLIQNGAVIAQAKPHLADRIAAQILKVERANYETAECRNVAIGHAVVALGEMLGRLQTPAPALAFVERQLQNSRSATRKKAERCLKTHQKGRAVSHAGT
jgi:hypothetical protein